MLTQLRQIAIRLPDPFKGSAALASLLIGLSVSSFSQPLQVEGHAFVQAGIGLYDVRRKSVSPMKQVELHFPTSFTGVQSIAGFAGSETDDSYLYAGLLHEFVLLKPILVSVSFSAGLYTRGTGIELGSPLEFRSAARAAWLWSSGFSLGIEIAHLSHAHLVESNPGLETLTILYAFPVRM